MECSSASLDRWREFFRSANASIFQVIEHAILVASADFTQEFRARRDQIVEKIFTVSVPSFEVPEEDNHTVPEILRIKEILTDHHDESEGVLFDSLRKLQLLDVTVQVLETTEIGKAVNGMRKHKSKKIRLLADGLIVNWKALVDQWLRTTAASADNSLDDAGNFVEFDKLMNVERCPLVNGEQKSKRHSLKHTANAKERADTKNPEPHAMNGPVKPQDHSLECTNLPKEEGGGLPCPPLDGVILDVETNSDQLSEVLHGMDDDESVGSLGKSEIQNDIESRLPLNDVQRSKQEPLKQHAIPNDLRETIREEPPEKKHSMKIVIKLKKKPEPSTSQVKCEGVMNKDEKPAVPDSGHSRSEQLVCEQEADDEIKPKQYEDQLGSQKKSVNRSQSSRPPRSGYEQNADTERKPTCYQTTAGSRLKSSVSNEMKASEEALLKRKLEVTKRKLREGYLQAENEKRQRTIHVLELNEIPKTTQKTDAIQKSRNNIRSSTIRRH